jgi:integrase
MSGSSSPKRRDTYHPTGTRGLSYLLRGDGTKKFYGYAKGRGRVPLQAPTKAEAKDEWHDLCRKASKSKPVDRSLSKKTVAEFVELWWACPTEELRPRYRNEREVRRYLDYTVKAWSAREISSVDIEDIFELDAQWKQAGHSESERANRFKPARRVFDYAVFKKAIDVSPFTQAPKGSLPSCNTKREHHEWTTKDVDRAIETAREFDLRPTARRRYADQFELMMRTGLRIAEASGLRFCDLDREDKVLHIRGQWTRDGRYVDYVKSKASKRRAPISDGQIAALDFRQSFYGLSNDDYIFADKPGGNPPSHSNFRRRCWNKVIEKTGLKLEEGVKVTPHDARHACASQLADRDLKSDDVAALLGHSSAKITEDIYIGAFNRDEREERIRKAMQAARNGGRES